ncbi:MAG: hypothetical protein KDK39_17165 [Leptospiraceae bacterium]|nr:hypothetical protein [Leptospiraceae bacterium]
MSNKTKIFIFGALALVVLVLLGILLANLSEEPNQPNVQLPDHQFESWDDNPEFPQGERAMDLFAESVNLSYDQIINQARSGQISLVSELWRLRRKCPRDMERYECNSLLRQYIMERFAEPDNKKLANLLVQYLKYEEEMTRLNLSNDLTLEERYAAIREKRREFFGDETAQLIFGLEESKHDLGRSVEEFKKDTANLSGDARMAAYEKLRREALGDYYDAVVAREPGFDKYNMELELRSHDLGKLDGAEKESATRDIRVKYFGEQGAKRMSAVDDMLAKEAKAEADLPGLESEFIKNNPDLSGDKLEAALLDLRTRQLGSKEAAEAYARRMQLSQSQKK